MAAPTQFRRKLPVNGSLLPLSPEVPMMEWICFRTVSMRERATAMSVSVELGVEAFAPQVSEIKQTRSGRKRFLQAMFPCYAFVRIDREKQIQDLRFARGVCSLPKFGGTIPAVSDAVLAEIKEDLNYRDELYIPEPETQAGQAVTFSAGPFQGLVGTLIRASGKDGRVAVLMDLLGRGVEVRVPRSTISVS